MARERADHPHSYAKDKKMKLLALHTYDCLIVIGPTVSADRGSLSRAVEFVFLPRNRAAEVFRRIRPYSAAFGVFHSNNSFFHKE